MAVIALDDITIAVAVDVEKVETWYRLQASTASPPSKPTAASPSGWSTTEPGYDGTTTSTLYTCQCTTLTDGTFFWGSVCVSSSYEAAKQAANAAASAAAAASDAQDTADDALEIAEATGAHFWQRSTDPDQDGAGTGAFVTDEEQATFLQAIASGTAPTTQRPLHNLLMNAEGILLRAAKKIRAAFTPSGVAFYDGAGNDAENIAAYFDSSGFQVGRTGESHLEGDYHSLQMLDKEGSPYFNVSDLRDTSGVVSVTEAFECNGSYTRFNLSVPATSTNYTVTRNGSTVTSGITKTTGYFTLSSAPAAGTSLTATYSTSTQLAKAYTFGIRGSGTVGLMSVAEGSGTVASAMYAHAEGMGSTASEKWAHAEGQSTIASGWSAHSEGVGSAASGSFSHAEGGHSKASGTCSHAEGDDTEASGAYSHAQNRGTKAASNYQTAIGKYNVADSSNTYALIVGNGTGTGSRSNAMTLDWNGNETLAGGLTLGSPLTIANGGTGETTAAAAWTALGGGTIGKKNSLAASDIPNHSTSKLTSGTLGIARGGTGSTGTTSKLNNSNATIYIWGKLVMVQLHGQTKAPDGTAIWSTAYLADYKPGYNISAIVAATSGELARVWVSADDGKIYLSAVNTSSSKAWYGTLTYMLA